MADWYHSGLEGYCKAAAKLAEEPATAASWGRFCNDIMKDRDFSSPATATRTWTLSRDRSGKSNRMKIFELAWLGEHAIAAGDDAEKRFVDTMSGNAKRISRSLIRDQAIEACENAAIEACVKALLEKDFGSELRKLASMPKATELFQEQVIPAIEDGFSSERYRLSDIRTYSQVLCESLNQDMLDDTCFVAFCKTLVAGLIYGPEHDIARKRIREKTIEYYVSSRTVEVSNTTVRLTQMFDNRLAIVGFSETFDINTAVFFGRDTDIKKYLDRCADCYGNDGDFLLALQDKEHVVFPISGVHYQTSGLHGVMTYIGNSWYFYDLDSTNGTSIENAGATIFANGPVVLRGGDRLRLGAPADTDDETLYWGATCILVSFFTNEIDM